MGSSFLKKLEEEKLQAQSGKPIDAEMQEEDEEDDDEEEDQVGGLDQIHDGIGTLNLGKAGMPPAAPKTMQGMKTGINPKQATKYDPLEWSDFYDTKEMMDGVVPIYHAGAQGHVFLCLHGAGHSAQSFASQARILKNEPYNSTCVSFDFRGHGEHFREDEADMSQQTLINDTIAVIKHVISRYPHQSIIMVGHSMGGSIATKAVDFIQNNHESEDWTKHLKGLFIIDVVEGSALDALPFMEQIVKSRPTEFSNLQSVVKYGISSNQVRDLQSAKVSMPA